MVWNAIEMHSSVRPPGSLHRLGKHLYLSRKQRAHEAPLCSLSGGLSTSFSSAFQLLHEQGVSLRTSFLVLSLCSILHILRTLLLMPRTHIPYPLPQYYTYGWVHYLVFFPQHYTRRLCCHEVLLLLTCRLSCGKANNYNVERFESMREDATTVSQESSESDNAPPEDGTESHESGKGIYLCFHHDIVRKISVQSVDLIISPLFLQEGAVVHRGCLTATDRRAVLWGEPEIWKGLPHLVWTVLWV